MKKYLADLRRKTRLEEACLTYAERPGFERLEKSRRKHRFTLQRNHRLYWEALDDSTMVVR